jgi:uncharacterized Zn finger protein (UPF0148 family)
MAKPGGGYPKMINVRCESCKHPKIQATGFCNLCGHITKR